MGKVLVTAAVQESLLWISLTQEHPSSMESKQVRQDLWLDQED